MFNCLGPAWKQLDTSPTCDQTNAASTGHFHLLACVAPVTRTSPLVPVARYTKISHTLH